MKRSSVALVALTCLLAAASVVIAFATVPQVLRIATGLLLVFVLPGYAAVCAVFPRRFAVDEGLVATIGISLVLTTCTAVVLAAAPVGLSRESFSVALGGLTLVLGAVALVRLSADLPTDDVTTRRSARESA